MLGFLLIYFIGKQFYTLADKYQKNKWMHAILGVIVYCGSIFFSGILLGIFMVIFNWVSLENFSDMQLGLIVLPFGLLAAYLYYVILKKYWSKSYIPVEDEIAQIGVINED